MGNILRIRQADGTFQTVPAIRGEIGPVGPIGPQGVPGTAEGLTDENGKLIEEAFPDALNDVITKLNGIAEGATKNTIATYTTTITTLWNGDTAPYTQTIAVSGIKETDNPTVDVILSSETETALLEEADWNKISKITTGSGIIQITCLKEKTSNPLHIQLKVVR